MPDSVRGFTSKFYALLATTFTDVVFMDADNLAVRDVTEIFDSAEYQETGELVIS